jgi:hypothetical protein
MVVLFQSWIYPLVIMVSVPLATFGGSLGLALVHYWSVSDRYMPIFRRRNFRRSASVSQCRLHQWAGRMTSGEKEEL